MSQKDARKVVSRAVTDEEFRQTLFSDPDKALSDYELTEQEVSALRSMPAETIDDFANNLDERISMAVVGYSADLLRAESMGEAYTGEVEVSSAYKAEVASEAYGNDATVDAYGSDATVDAYGSDATVDAYGSDATVDAYGSEATVDAYGNEATVDAYGSEAMGDAMAADASAEALGADVTADTMAAEADAADALQSEAMVGEVFGAEGAAAGTGVDQTLSWLARLQAALGFGEGKGIGGAGSGHDVY